MATLEGSELVNVESVTALMSLFGAKYMGSYIKTSASGFVRRGNASYKSKIIVSSDGSTINVPNISDDGDSTFTCSFSLTSKSDGLFFMRSSYTVTTEGSNSNQKLTITPKTSLNTTKFTPTSFSISSLFGHVTTDETMFETMFRLKAGETFSYKEVYDIYTTTQVAQTYFELYRIC